MRNDIDENLTKALDWQAAPLPSRWRALFIAAVIAAALLWLHQYTRGRLDDLLAHANDRPKAGKVQGQ